MKCKHNYDNYGHCMNCYHVQSVGAKRKSNHDKRQKEAGMVYFQRWVTLQERDAMTNFLNANRSNLNEMQS